ncbi:MAG TPA: xanthine dehydrogenase family protein molybdopterin-binding subunit [Vicinamibacteria bacterium]|nr:xanthine dehydrogenase family protein molybdopterin-binding subunit [Vicinamibacteria bacterium]
MTETRPAPWGETTVVGKPRPRVDGFERVSGRAVYAMDVTFPDLLHAAIVRCPHAHARVRKVDTSKAERMPGVRAVLTGGSPGANLPWHFGEKGPLSLLFDPHCRHEGEEVAAVAADTPQQAKDAARAVAVEYEELPFVVDYADALKPGAPAVHDSGNRNGEPDKYERGDVAKGFAEAEVVVERTFKTPCEIHTPMEPHGSVAKWDGGRLTVWDTNQGVFDIRSGLAQWLQMPLTSVRVISKYMGGGFGSKLEPGKYTVIAALLARKTGRPVRCFLSREESFLCVGNRPPNTLTLKAGAKKDGTLLALQLTGLGTSGAYPDGSGAGYLVTDLYSCPNVRTEETDVFINAGKSRAFRAPGFPQCAWALEQVMDELAEKLGIDPVELRLKNVPTVSQRRKNQPFTSTGLARCLREGAEAFGWKAARATPRGGGAVVRGVGVAAGMWGWEGEPRSTIIVKYAADGSVDLGMGASDIGTGTKTVMAMVVAEELGAPLDRIQIDHADTGTTPSAVSSGGSQTTHVNAPAVRAAALDVKRQLLEMAAEQLKVEATSLSLEEGEIVAAGPPEAKLALKDLKSLQEQQVVVGVGHRHPHPKDKIGLPFVAHFAEVEVDTRTGEVRVLRLLGAHDSGRVMYPLGYENQVFGGMTMGIGFAMTEERRLDPNTGRMVNANWHDYKLPTALDVPAKPVCLPIDPHDTEINTVGAKGIGEPATIPTAAAIANAVHHATGLRITEPSINPVQMAQKLWARR